MLKKIFKKNQIIITALALMIAVAGYLQYTGTKIDDKSAAKEASSELKDDSYEISDEDMYNAEDIFTDTEDNSEDKADKKETAKTDGTGDGAQTANADGAETAKADGTGDGTQAADGTEAAGAGGKETADAGGAEGAQEAAENPGEAVLTSSNVENLDFAAEVKLNREQIRSKNKETLLEVINNAAITEAQKQDAVNAMINLTDISEREAAAEMLLEAKGFTDVVVSISDSNVDVVLNMGEVTDAKRAQVEDIVKRKTNIAAENIVITPIQVTAETK